MNRFATAIPVAIAALIAILTTTASAQQDKPSDVTLTMAAYGRCVVQSAQRYAPTKELPSDIVDASFAFCRREKTSVYDALTAFWVSQPGQMPHPQDVKATIAETEHDIRRAAIRAILEKRYPEVK